MAVTEETFRRTNEVPGTRAHLSNLRTSAYKVREVLNLIRGKSIAEARDILRFTDRGPAEPILKLLNSAVANAEHNDEQREEELFVGACFADEGTTMKRFRPRARGRASKIRKRGSHITIVVSRMDEERLARLAEQAPQSSGRGQRVANSRANRVAAGRENEEASSTEQSDETEVSSAEESVKANAPKGSDTTPASEADATVADTTEEAEANEAVDASAKKTEKSNAADAQEEGK